MLSCGGARCRSPVGAKADSSQFDTSCEESKYDKHRYQHSVAFDENI